VRNVGVAGTKRKEERVAAEMRAWTLIFSMTG